MAKGKNGTKAEAGAEARGVNVENTEATSQQPRSVAISAGGIRTGEDFADLMSALMSDVIDGSLNAGTVNAAVNAGGKLLKVVEMQYRYGRQPAETSPSPIMLSRGNG